MELRHAATVAAIAGAAACCPRVAAPPFPVPPPPPATPAPVAVKAPPRAIPAPVVGRFQEPSPPAAEPASEPPIKREMITEPPLALPGPKLDEVPVTREPLAPPRPPPPTETLPDDVVLRLLETGRVLFVRCFKKAIAADPTELSFKVHLHVELDENGAITAARTDATNPTLDACLVRSAGWLRFPQPGRRVAVDLPLFYRAE